jgi:hypothetical protein
LLMAPPVRRLGAAMEAAFAALIYGLRTAGF